MVVFSKQLNSFSGEVAQHGRPLQTPLVSLINSHAMSGCLYCVTYQFTTYFTFYLIFSFR